MIIFKKFVEGIAIINDDTGESRLLSEIEKNTLFEIMPTLKDPKTISYMTDYLPDGIK